jgi:tRNA threonylcarbamoyladenosine biosynthesis protein TsaE
MTQRKILLSRSANETMDFARKLAKTLKPGTVISLEGNLGSGKTTLIKGIALGLGLKRVDDVKSPTFVLLHLYATRIPLYHFDLYRLESEKELLAIGLEDFMEDPKAICCIEWGERAAGLLPKRTLRLRLKILRNHSRQIMVVRPKLSTRFARRNHKRYPIK